MGCDRHAARDFDFVELRSSVYYANMAMHFQYQNDPRFRVWQQRMNGRPGWVWKSAAFAAVLVVVVPLVLLTLTAIVVGVAVFAAMSLIAAIGRAFGQIGGDDRSVDSDAPTQGPERRENVRIIER